MYVCVCVVRVLKNRNLSDSAIRILSLSDQKQDRQCTYNVPMRHFHETIAAMEKQ
jgi:hypothetical protein